MRTSKVLVGAMVILVALASATSPLYAYVGPGGVISGFGALLALIASFFAAVFGFVWFPVKRLVKRMRSRSRKVEYGDTSDVATGE